MEIYMDRADLSLEKAATTLENSLKDFILDKEFFVGRTEESMKENLIIVEDGDMAPNTTRTEI